MNSTISSSIGIENFRGLGGYKSNDGRKVRQNMVYRSARLDGLTKEGHKFLDKLNIKTIIDFRDDTEVADSPTTYKKEGVTTLRIPISSGDIKAFIPYLVSGKFKESDAKALMCNAYRTFVTGFGKQYAQFLETLLDEANYPILFHCTAGKDRTGYAAALLLSLLNVPWEDILDNYLLTNSYLQDFISKIDIGEMPEVARKAFAVLMIADEQYLDTAFNVIGKDYERVASYSSEVLNFGKEKQEKLKSILME